MNKPSARRQLAREAKAIVALAFRNGPIESLHAGTPCPTCAGKSGYSRTSEQSGVYAGSLDDKSTKLLVRTTASAVYAPPGYLLFVDGDTLLGEAFNADRLEVSGQPFLIAEHVGRSSAFQSAISASRTGTIAYSVPLAQNTRLTWFDRAGKPLNSAGMDGYYSDFRLSPDEKSLAASLVNPKTGVIDIWVNDLARGSNTRITRGELLSASANWSPDGARLTFRTFRGGMIEFYQKSAAGGGDDASVLTAQAESAAQIQSVNLVPTDWSPDGKLIAFSAPTVASGNDLWLLPLTGDRKPVKFLATPADEMHGNFSPTDASWPTPRMNRAGTKSMSRPFRSPTRNGKSPPTADTSPAGAPMGAKSTISPRTAS